MNFKKLMFLSITIGLVGTCGSAWGMEEEKNNGLPDRITQEQQNNLNTTYAQLQQVSTQEDTIAYKTKHNNLYKWICITFFLKKSLHVATASTSAIGLGLGLFGYIATNLDTRALLANLRDGVTYVSFFTFLSGVVTTSVMNILTKKFKTHNEISSMPDDFSTAIKNVKSSWESIQKSMLPTDSEKKLLSTYMNQERQIWASLFDDWKVLNEPIQCCKLSCYSKSGNEIITLSEPEN
jgi:hypothetical protein